jgi:Acyltransferase family
MASSPEILTSPLEFPVGPGPRGRWADNLRVLVIALVVVWHTAMAYLGGTGWYYLDRTTSKSWAAAVTPAWVFAGFALGPLFLVAGWFSARSLARNGAGAFAGTRLLRLGVPLIVFIFLINPLATYLGNLRGPATRAWRTTWAGRTEPGRCGSSQRCWPSHWRTLCCPPPRCPPREHRSTTQPIPPPTQTTRLGAARMAMRAAPVVDQIGGNVRATEFEAWLRRVTSEPRLGGGAGARAACGSGPARARNEVQGCAVADPGRAVEVR